MAESIISPGVFIREKDQSFLAPGIANLGGVVIGPTPEGPALVPVLVSNFDDYKQRFGSVLNTSTFDPSISPYTDEAVYSYFVGTGGSGPGLTVVRTLGAGGFKTDSGLVLGIKTGSAADATASVILLPTIKSGSVILSKSIVETIGGSYVSASLFGLKLSGSINKSYTASLNPSDNLYIGNIFGYSEYGDKELFVYSEFKEYNKNSYTDATASMVNNASLYWSGSLFGNFGFSKAETPFIRNVNGDNLFRFYTISDGSDVNNKFKLQISNIRKIVAEDLYRFDVVLRKYDDTDTNIVELERFSQVSLDTGDPRYICRIIGNKYIEIDSDGNRTEKGIYANRSKFVYISMSDRSYNKNDYPWGFGKVFKPIDFVLPKVEYEKSLIATSSVGTRLVFGWKFGDATNNIGYLYPKTAKTSLVTSVTEDTETFSLSNCTVDSVTVTINTDKSYLRFIVPFQGGFDGVSPYTQKYIGSSIASSNYFGFDLSASDKIGYKVYEAAIKSLENPDEIDINLVVVPGVIHSLHGSLSNKIMQLCLDRGDCFAIIDSSGMTDSITDVTSNTSTLDNNYIATYYPWVFMNGRFVPPSVAVIGAYKQSDRIGEEWYAPAGLNRGGLSSFGVTGIYKVLKHSERDTLYEGRVNPIARFVTQATTPNIVVYGQKTMQAKPSALDRVNVRRLLINLKKFVAASSKFLVFEPNNAATRQKFLNMVNPYLESVQQKNGLNAFKVVMDNTNNTAEIIDRNQLVGQIFLQPTRVAEFIVLDFVVLPTGASFPS